MDALATDYPSHLRTLGIDPTGLMLDADGTLTAPDPAVSPITIDLPALVVIATDEDGAAADLVRHDVIGRGGMGHVWSATQKSLRRQVAVKELIDAERPHARAALLREAMITGALEHPNIVPVHMLGRDDRGRPLLVMKKIEGTRWSEILRPLYGPQGPADPQEIEHQLGIFVHVCNAIDFAHARGVIHRDLKPDNVMVGSFGEVYVLDWGIARTIDPARFGVPAARAQLVGTPGYMAPEMAAADPERCDVRTDVYLLGAVLHEVVTGSRRHGGEGVLATLANAYKSAPVAYSKVVPAELAEICNRATAVDPDARFADVRSLRDAVTAFLRHRASRQLADKAHVRLRALEALLSDQARGRTADAVEIHQLASEARFGLEQALHEWNDNTVARARLQRLLERMIDYEIGNDNVRAAAGLLAELPERRPELEQKMREAVVAASKRKREIASLERMRSEGDLSQHARDRLRLAILYGSVLTLAVGTLTTLRLLGVHEAGYPDALAVVGLFTALTFATRRTFRTLNVVNRRIMDGIVATALLITVSLAIAWLGDAPFATGLAIAMLVASVATTMMAVFVERGLVWPALAFVAAAALIVIVPAARGIVMTLGCFLGFSVGAWVWHKNDQAASRAPRLVRHSGLQRSALRSTDE